MEIETKAFKTKHNTVFIFILLSLYCLYFHITLIILFFIFILLIKLEESLIVGNKAKERIFRKTNISYPLIRTRTCAYQRIRNVSFS